MKASSAPESKKIQASNKLYKSSRDFRQDKLVESWSRVPEIGAGFELLPLQEQRNLATHLDNEARFIMRLKENQTSTALMGFSPENMLRTTRYTMPQVIRSKIFTEFAMESGRDIMECFRPVYSKTRKDYQMDGRNPEGTFSGARNASDPFETNRDVMDTDINSDNPLKAIFEQPESRFTQELANGIVGATVDTAVKVNGIAVATPTTSFTPTCFVTFGSTDAAKNEFSLGYIDGYSVITGKKETDVYAIQNKNNGSWMCANGVKVEGAKGVYGVYFDPTVFSTVPAVADIKAFGRFDSEGDYEGNYLGEIELRISKYEFKPRPTAVGVTWSQLSEIVFDASYGESIEEHLVTAASQEIRVSLDSEAIKLAYRVALTNKKNYTVKFNAGYDPTQTGVNIKQAYIENAQTFQTALAKVSDVMLNDIRRGGVSRIIGGPSAVSYTMLMKEYDSKGKMTPKGPHQFGELDSIPLFKVPSDIIPTNRFLTVWKDDQNESDVACVFGTLVPFFSTGLIQRKNFYTETALASFGDHNVINKRYLAIIEVENLKDTTDA
jgi:hypothetical protein